LQPAIIFAQNLQGFLSKTFSHVCDKMCYKTLRELEVMVILPDPYEKLQQVVRKIKLQVMRDMHHSRIYIIISVW
jgi:hypothetical protein